MLVCNEVCINIKSEGKNLVIMPLVCITVDGEYKIFMTYSIIP